MRHPEKCSSRVARSTRIKTTDRTMTIFFYALGTITVFLIGAVVLIHLGNQEAGRRHEL